LIRAYDWNLHEIDKFTLTSSDGDFLLHGKVIDYLFYIFEAKLNSQAYAITRREVQDGDVGEISNSSILEGGSQEPIRSEGFSHLNTIKGLNFPPQIANSVYSMSSFATTK
jgi:hypothetical protein